MTLLSAEPRPARILYLITDLQRGGVPLHLLRLVRALDRRRYDPLVACLAPRGPVSDLIERERISTAALGARHPLDLTALWRLHRLIARTRPRLIHALLFHANVAARLVGPLAGVPPHRIITEIQTVEIERRWHLTLDNLTLRRSHLEAGNSPAVVEHLHSRAHIPRSRLLCMPGGVDVAAIDAAPAVPRSALGIASDAPLLMWVGRIDPIKGLETLLAAADLLAPSHDFALALIGDGPHRRDVEAQRARLACAGRIHLAGQRADVHSLLKLADVFVFPSRTEGLPNALLEAMAAARPIVASDVPGCRDLVRHDVEGLLVPPDAPRALADAVARMLTNRTLAARLAAAARLRAIEAFSFPACVQRWETLYYRLLSRTSV